MIVLKAGLIDFQVVEQIDDLSSTGVDVSVSVHKDNLVLVHRDPVLDIPRKFLVEDHEDYDLEALRGQMHEVGYGLTLQFI